jgi:hypothetical protein
MHEPAPPKLFQQSLFEPSSDGHSSDDRFTADASLYRIPVLGLKFKLSSTQFPNAKKARDLGVSLRGGRATIELWQR